MSPAPRFDSKHLQVASAIAACAFLRDQTRSSLAACGLRLAQPSGMVYDLNLVRRRREEDIQVSDVLNLIQLTQSSQDQSSTHFAVQAAIERSRTSSSQSVPHTQAIQSYGVPPTRLPTKTTTTTTKTTTTTWAPQRPVRPAASAPPSALLLSSFASAAQAEAVAPPPVRMALPAMRCFQRLQHAAQQRIAEASYLAWEDTSTLWHMLASREANAERMA